MPNLLKTAAPFLLLLLLSAAILAAIFVPSRKAEDQFAHGRPDVVTVTMSPGGVIWEFYQQYSDQRLSGSKLRIDGMCASACTFFLGLMPPERVCATPYARLGFHGVQSGFPGMGYSYNAKVTKSFFPLVYPDRVLQMFKDLGWDYETTDAPDGMIWIPASDLGVQPCDPTP